MFIFVCGSFARSGSLHGVMDGIPLIARAAVEGRTSVQGGLTFLINEGTAKVDGEIYEVPDAHWQIFLASLREVCAPVKVKANPIDVSVRGQVMVCVYFTPFS